MLGHFEVESLLLTKVSGGVKLSAATPARLSKAKFSFAAGNSSENALIGVFLGSMGFPWGRRWGWNPVLNFKLELPGDDFNGFLSVK